MAIIAYQKNEQTLYTVTVEAINRYTGKRVQKKRSGILSLPKAERIYRELWNVCREERPDGASIKTWGELVDIYYDHLHGKIRSSENSGGFSPRSVQTKLSRLRHVEFWRSVHIDLITPLLLTNELDKIEASGTSRSMTNLILKEVKCTFAFAVHMGAIKTNPMTGLKARRSIKKRKEALTHVESNRLLSEAKRRGHSYYQVWLLTLALGLRRSELAGLQWLDINFEHRLVYLRRQKIPGEGVVPFLKDREERVVAIPAFVIPELKKMRGTAKTDFVIELDCRFWETGMQADVLRKFCREIGIKEVTHHQLRATHITLALIDGIPLGIVKENVGHAKLSTTDEYFRSAGIDMRGQTDGLRIHVPQDEEDKVVRLHLVK